MPFDAGTRRSEIPRHSFETDEQIIQPQSNIRRFSVHQRSPRGSRVKGERLRAEAVCFGQVVGHAAVDQSRFRRICVKSYALVLNIAIDFGEMLQSFERTYDMSGVHTHQVEHISLPAQGLSGLAGRSEEMFGSLASILKIHRSHRLCP